MQKVSAIVAAVLLTSCAEPPPAPPPPPPAAVFQPIPVTPQENLSIQARSQSAGPGKQTVMIFANGEHVIEGTLTTSSPRGTFRGKYREHEIEAKCTLKERVDCEILVDGSPEAAAGGHERP